MNEKYRISLLFNANKAYDRQVIKGIGEYLQTTQCDWDIFFDEDFCTKVENIKNWIGDGIIADLDDPKIEQLVSSLDIPIVGVGGSYEEEKNYPGFPYVATDNESLVNTAFNYLKDKGLENFAFYGIPNNNLNRWAKERENAFNKITHQERYYASIYQGKIITPQTWQADMKCLARWLKELPLPIGIISVTDARARHLLQTCENIGLMVPEQISIIGIDNEELTRYLTRTPLSSVGQGCLAMGHSAARMLHNILIRNAGKKDVIIKKKYGHPRIIIPASRVFARTSTDFQSISDPFVMKAMHYIRNNAYNGIKVEQVLDALVISRSNLEVRFKKARGHSIHQEIHNSKLKRACELLCSTRIIIAEIPKLCGYPSLQYMYTVFKKDMNQTPKEYRIKNTSQ